MLAFLVAFEVVLIKRPDVGSSPLTGPRTLQFEPGLLAEPAANPFAAPLDPPPAPAPPVELAPRQAPTARKFRASELGPIDHEAPPPTERET